MKYQNSLTWKILPEILLIVRDICWKNRGLLKNISSINVASCSRLNSYKYLSGQCLSSLNYYAILTKKNIYIKIFSSLDFRLSNERRFDLIIISIRKKKNGGNWLIRTNFLFYFFFSLFPGGRQVMRNRKSAAM